MSQISVACLTICLLVSTVNQAAAAVQSKTEQGTVALDNGALLVRYDIKSGTFTARRGERTFITEGRLVEADKQEGAVAKLVDVEGPLGTGKAIEVTWPDGRIRRLALYDGLPFVCASSAIRNVSDKSITVKSITPLVATVDLDVPANELKGFGPTGLSGIGNTTNFCFAAAADPKTRRGVVCGWLSHFRASGVVTLAKADQRVSFVAESQYGRLLVPAGAAAEGETTAIGYFDDALDGLEAYADGIAKAHEIKLRDKVPSGYCTWYHARASNQDRTAELADFCGKELKKFGFDFIQIDDGWQIGSRDFTTYNPRGSYSLGMKPTAEKIRDNGLVAGIWYIPFGWDPKCKALADHHDWFVKKPDGSIYSVRWAGSCLDMTHPEARKFLSGVVAQMSRDWNYKYIKIDGLWSGMAVKILYPSLNYRWDDLGQAVLHDPGKTQVEAYRDGLKLVRRAAGDDVFILGCNIAQNCRTLGGSFGLMDGMRIGPDIGAAWGGMVRCAQPTSHLYFLHTKVWFNDPDCLMLRNPLSLDQARVWGSVLALSGQLNVVSEWLPGLPPEKLDVVKRTMPNHNGLGRPIDLFENNLPSMWHYRGRIAGGRVDLIALINWNNKEPKTAQLDLAKIGLPAGPQDRYVGFDFWENTFVTPFAASRKFELRPASCRVIALHHLADHPQLVSTSRHVTQGVIDVATVAWDPEKSTLAGKSRLVAGDPYELRIATPRAGSDSFQAVSAGVSEADKKAGVTVEFNQDEPNARVMLNSPVCREVSWSVAFKNGSR